ncbi:MAG: hypothetical protein U9O82_07110 [Thermodesulfobacteriota bacterium]|nr:hypothetical protein [Thermodesulfobacteriota bacterium]
MQEMEHVIESWQDTNGMKSVFLRIKNFLEAQKEAELSFNARPGVSYSLRAAHPGQKNRSLYVMADVVDDDPKDRWLSVCFFEDMITDPEEKGDIIPDGLLGEDGYCFDITEPDEKLAAYVEARIEEAYHSAKIE